MHRKVLETPVKKLTKDILGEGTVEGRRHVEEMMGSHHSHVDVVVRVSSLCLDPQSEVGQLEPMELI